MKIGTRWLWIGSAAFLALPQAFGQAVSDYKTLITDGGELRILRTGQSVCKVRFGLFYDNWNELRPYDVGPNSDGSWSSKGSLGSGEMNIRSTVNVIGNTARLTIQATPTRSLTANTAHINIRFDEAFWADSNFNAITYVTILPRLLGTSISSMGKRTDRFIVNSPHGLGITMQLPASHDYHLRDSRPYGIGYELRAQQSSGPWAAGVTKTYVLDLTPNQAMPIGPNQTITVQPSADWIPIDHKLNIMPGSVLDWSVPNPIVAGSSGFVKATASGQLYAEQEPAKRLKFFGTNVSSSAIFVDSAMQTQLADQLARMGYNMVRLHHFDEILIQGSALNSTTLHPYYLERFHNFIELLRRRGMYVAIDLYSMRRPKTNEILPGDLSVVDYKTLLLASTAARSNWLQYSLNLLNSVSPHTGRKLKDEPALAFIQLVNEQSPLVWKRETIRPDIWSAVEAALGRPWGTPTDDLARAFDGLIQTQYDWMKNNLRANGVRQMLSLHNVGVENAASGIRSKVDFQDSHVYYSHPQWLERKWELPASILPTPPLKNLEWFGMLAGARVHNKPFFVGEHDGAAPSPYRGEYGLMMGVIGTVQNWDAMLRFGYSDRPQYLEGVLPINYFVTVSDPSSMATERAIKALYHRGDLTANDTTTVINVPYSSAGLGDQRGVPLVKNGVLLKPFAMSNTTGSSTYATPIIDGISARPDGSVIADLFQQTMKINTPNTCGVIANPGALHTMGRLSVLLGGARGTVWASSHDGQPLANSKRVLFVHLTEVHNTGTTWTGDERMIVTDMGTLPHIARNGTAQITLNLQNPSTARVY
ncbi:MAG TPA: cellulase family glycosylhydrolase, partial [Fimbriimonadaceae bacterium]|nr:cellulase family glycosylhydrolase [Fimbriimonadaceae bacterium]